MNILHQSIAFVHQKIIPTIPKRHRKLFAFGVQAFTLQSYSSLNGNARMVIANRKTAESKVYRLTKKKAFFTYFTKLLPTLKLVQACDTVNVDFSTFCGFQVLTFAKQTQLGRAIPLYFAVLTYPIKDPGSQTQFVMKTIKTFTRLVGFKVHLVFDRGFESPHIVPFLVKGKLPFTLRLRQDKHVSWLGKNLPLKNLPWWANDCLVTVYEHKLRVVVSDKKTGMEQPWYILTNHTQSTREQVISRYYFRFEIEETFKDLKHINKLKHLFPIKKLLTFAILLWFAILTIWLAFLIDAMRSYLTKRITLKKNKRLSLTRYFFEQIQEAKTILLKEVYAM